MLQTLACAGTSLIRLSSELVSKKSKLSWFSLVVALSEMTDSCIFYVWTRVFSFAMNHMSTINKFNQTKCQWRCPTSSSIRPSAARQRCCVDKKQLWWPVSRTHQYHSHSKSHAGSWLRCCCTLKPLQARYVQLLPRLFGLLQKLLGKNVWWRY